MRDVKRRTGLLFSSAVALGLAGGTATGFLIQQSRPATPLPPIQQTLVAAAQPGTPDPHDATTDDGAKLDGDLRAVLLAKPAGAKDPVNFTARDWFTIADLADYYHDPGFALVRLNSYEFRRAARTGWTLADGTVVEIDLVQFRNSDGAASYLGMTGVTPDESEQYIRGSASGFLKQFSTKDARGLYMSYGQVQHGTVVEQVFVTSRTSVPPLYEVMKVTQDQADLL